MDFASTRVTMAVALHVVGSKIKAEGQKTWECKKVGYFLENSLQILRVAAIIPRGVFEEASKEANILKKSALMLAILSIVPLYC